MHDHIQLKDGNTGFSGDHLGGGDTAKGLRKNGGKTVVAHFRDQMNQLRGGGFAAGLLFNSLQNDQTKGIGQICKTVMEGDQLPAAEGRELCFTVGLQRIQILKKG